MKRYITLLSEVDANSILPLQQYNANKKIKPIEYNDDSLFLIPKAASSALSSNARLFAIVSVLGL